MSAAVIRRHPPPLLSSRTAHHVKRRAASSPSAPAPVAATPAVGGRIADAKLRVRPSWSPDRWRRDELRRIPLPPPLPDAASMAVRPLPKAADSVDLTRPGRFSHDLADWPDVGAFSLDRLERTRGGVEVCVGVEDEAGEEEVTLPLSTYLSYARRDSDGDDCPLYAFDEWILGDDDNNGEDDGGGEDRLSSAYAAPHCFPHDFMALMGEEDRPPYRWLLIGAGRSGTAPHVDPAATAAWNTLVSGRKRWVMFPPSSRANGSGGNGEDYNEDSGCEGSAIHWLHKIYPFSAPIRDGALDFIQLPGETVYVPPGWVHAAVNLELSVAVTHNFVGPRNVHDALEAMNMHDPETASRWEEKLFREGHIEGARCR